MQRWGQNSHTRQELQLGLAWVNAVWSVLTNLSFNGSYRINRQWSGQSVKTLLHDTLGHTVAGASMRLIDCEFEM
jgi:hypothetical protein